MTLFDNELKRVVEKYAASVDNNLLGFWHLVFSERHEVYRNTLENCFNELPLTIQKKIKARILADNKGFYETLNEMIIGSFLTALGYSLHYEPNLEGKTPDWLIQSCDDKNIILDVFTSKTPTYMQKQDEVAITLMDKVAKLKYKVLLWGEIKDPYLAERNTNQIVKAISDWLISKPQIGDSFSTNGIEIKLEPYGEMPYTGLIFNIDDSKRNDFKDLPEKIIEKANKYKDISTNQKIPFVVALVLDRMLVDESTIENLICRFPSDITTKYFRKKNGDIYTKKFAPDGNGGQFEIENIYDAGVFRNNSLSGVLAFWFQSRQLINVVLFRNPKASFPLPEYAFEKIRK